MTYAPQLCLDGEFCLRNPEGCSGSCERDPMGQLAAARSALDTAVKAAADWAQTRIDPIKARVHLRNNMYIDLLVVVPWDQWLKALHVWGGIAHDAGFIPLHAIDLVAHLPAATDDFKPGELGSNVVALRPKA